MQLNGTWTATSILRTHSRLTGERYSLQNLARIIIHEQFHVFQKWKHPDWRPNDGYLFTYPLDTPDILALRRMETEAFRRAVITQNDKEVLGWVKEALKWRDKRYPLLEDALVNYEGELQRFEGLAEYIECKSGDKEIAKISVDPGFAPGAIRHLGYVLGRWSAAILDRLEPNWKDFMESGQTQYLHELLKKIAHSSVQICEFSEAEQEIIFQKAQDSLVMLRNEKGSVTVRDLMSITSNNGLTGVLKFTIAGIKEIPLIEKKEDRIKVTTKGFQAEFKGAQIVESKNVIKIML